MDRKLTLDLETISVNTFAPQENRADLRGTVKAREDGPGCPWSQPFSCPATSHTCTV